MMKKALPLVAVALSLVAADWPQWRGPNRDGVSAEKGLLQEWPDGGPKLLWTYKDAGEGYSSPAIVGARLSCAGARGDTEFVYALDLTKSPPTQQWAIPMGPKFQWKSNKWNNGPSATPTVDGKYVYAIGGFGDVVCVDEQNGALKWKKSLAKDLGGEVNAIGGGLEKFGWGHCASPLIDGDHLIVVPGGEKGTLAALHKLTGEVVWRSKDLTDAATYASPVVATLDGVKQYLVMTNLGVAGVGTKGDLLWYYKRAREYSDIVAFTPIARDGLVFVSAAGSGGGSDLVKVTKAGDKWTAERGVLNRDLASFHGGAVLVGDHVYGASGDFSRTSWVSVDFKSGKTAWSKGDNELGKGAIAAADGRLYALGEKDGVVKLLEASPRAFAVKGKFTLPNEAKTRLESGAFWTHPVIANGRLYLRDQEMLYCYDVKGK